MKKIIVFMFVMVVAATAAQAGWQEIQAGYSFGEYCGQKINYITLEINFSGENISLAKGPWLGKSFWILGAKADAPLAYARVFNGQKQAMKFPHGATWFCIGRLGLVAHWDGFGRGPTGHATIRQGRTPPIRVPYPAEWPCSGPDCPCWLVFYIGQRPISGAISLRGLDSPENF